MSETTMTRKQIIATLKSLRKCLRSAELVNSPNAKHFADRIAYWQIDPLVPRQLGVQSNLTIIGAANVNIRVGRIRIGISQSVKLE